MNRLVFVGLFILVTCLAGAGSTTFFIAANGSDSNNGTSKNTPWSHLPGMASCAAKCSTTVPAAGDQFIFRGCDVWGNSNFSILWPWGGSSGSPITIGVDKTWQNTTNCPSTWNRPIWDAGGANITGTNSFFNGQTGLKFLTMDNIEVKGYHWSTITGNLQTMICFGNCAGGTTNITATNLYIHGWSHSALGSGGDECTVFQGSSTSPYLSGSIFDHIVIDGSDSTNGGDSCRTFEFTPTVTNSIVHDVSNGIRPAGSGEIGFNQIYRMKKSFDATIHENAIETQGGAAGTFYIHDNYVHDNQVSEGMQVGGTGESIYAWNNIWSLLTGLGGGNPPAIPRNDGFAVAAGTIALWNNTIIPQTGVNCIHRTGAAGSTIAVLYVQNEHCISTAGLNDSFAGVANTSFIDHNTVMSPAIATVQGYTPFEVFVYSPTLLSNATVAAGTKVCGVAVICTGSLASLANDTTYACNQITVNGVVQSVCPARTAVLRPATPDTGAYQFQAGKIPPNAPTNLVAIPH